MVLTLCMTSTPAHAAATIEGIWEFRLKNGLKVILLENHKTPAVTFQVWYRAGARNEQWGKTGLAHLFEHMMFKGTKTVSADEFTRRIQQKGASYNAFTSHDFAGYFEKLASKHIQTVLELEADRMLNLTFTDQEFNTEKQVVMEERRLRIKDNPKAYLLEQVSATAFQVQPYHWPISGWMTDLNRLSPEDARKWYRTYYHPSNACIVAVGDFISKRLMDDIRKAFGRIPSGNGPFRTGYAESPQNGERRIQVKTNKTQTPFLALGYHVPNISGADGYALEILSAVLTGGRSARLLEHLMEKRQLTRQIQTHYSLLSFDPNLFVILTEPFPDVDIDTLEQAIVEEIEKLQDGPIDERELETAKNQLEASFIFAQDSIVHQAMLLARYELTTGWREVNDYVSSIRSVSASDVKQVARRYLIPDNRTAGVLVPEDAE
jgi:zinc protease